MARIAGVDIPREKRLEISLTYIFGIGRTTAQQICEQTGIDPNTRVRDLTDEEVNKHPHLDRREPQGRGRPAAATSSRTSSARWRSAATRACATAAACRSGVSAPTPTPAPARARRRPWPARRR